MGVVQKVQRFFQVASYNRDWMKFILPSKNGHGQRTEEFRLRNGQVLAVPRDARFILNEIYLDRVYDAPGMDVSDLRHILDLGANVGLFATYMASRNPQATVYCFEPSRSNFQDLQGNITRNKVNARLFPLAVSSHEGLGYLSHAGSSVEFALVSEAGDNTEEVDCIPLDNVFSLCEVDRFDLLKLDIEGFEKPLLDGASDEQLARFDRMIVEWHYSWDELEALAERLRGIGFKAEPTLIEGHMRFLYATHQSVAT